MRLFKKIVLGVVLICATVGLWEIASSKPEVTYSQYEGTVIAKEHNVVKVGKNGYHNQYYFAMKYDAYQSNVIRVDLATYTEKEVGDEFSYQVETREDQSLALLGMAALLFGICIIFSIVFLISIINDVFEYCAERKRLR